MNQAMHWAVPTEQALACFPSDYTHARAAFVAAARDRRAELTCFPVEGHGPDGGSLSVDTAWMGASDAEAVLVMLSGTHGVEGFAGSAAQCDVLRHANSLPNVAFLLVHALTPWGFAWCDRTDGEGVDLNRNFVDHQNPPNNDAYDELAEALVPTDESAETVARSEEFLLKWRRAHGDQAYDTARRAGQYRHPRGLYYGGRAPSAGRRALEDVARKYSLHQRTVAVIDWHTGLGPFGYGELQSELPRTHPFFVDAEAIFGPELGSPYDGSSGSTVLHGTVQDGLMAILNNRSHLYACLEFGTYGPMQARAVLLGLARLRSGHDIDATAVRLAARRFFFPDTPGWNEMVLWRGRQIVRRLVDKLSGPGSVR